MNNSLIIDKNDFGALSYMERQNLTLKEKNQILKNVDIYSLMPKLYKEYEEVYWSEQPINTNTLRVAFENTTYDPASENKCPGGIWNKIKTKYANIWDWTREDSNWYRNNSFGTNNNDGIKATIKPPRDNPRAYVSFVTSYEILPNCPVLTEKFKLINSDTSNVANLKAAFQLCLGLTEIWKPFDFSSCTDVSYMFMCADSLRTIGEDKWVLPVATTAANMFYCAGAENLPFIEFPIATSLYKSFMGMKNLRVADGFDAPNATDVRDIYEADVHLVEVKTLGDTSKVQTWHDAFSCCVMLQKVPEIIDCTAGVDCEGIFGYCYSLPKTPTLIFGENVTTLAWLWACCTCLEEIPDNPAYHYVSNMRSVLSAQDDGWSDASGVYIPEQLVDMKLKKLPDWKPENITNADYMFYGLKHVSKESVEEWFNFLKNSPTLVSHVGTFRECAYNENIPYDWK